MFCCYWCCAILLPREGNSLELPLGVRDSFSDAPESVSGSDFCLPWGPMIQLLISGAGGRDTSAHTERASQISHFPLLFVEESNLWGAYSRASWFGWVLLSLGSDGLSSVVPRENTLFTSAAMSTSWRKLSFLVTAGYVSWDWNIWACALNKHQTESPRLFKAHQEERT